MVCEWGMSEKIGPLHFGRNEEMVFLGRDFAEHKEYSEQTAEDIDAEVRRIVTENLDRAKLVNHGQHGQAERAGRGPARVRNH